MNPTPSERTPEAEVDPQFLERWSPRAFADDPVDAAHLASLFEAARWAPSCFNEQPWLFVYAVEAEDRARVLDLLVEANRAWARRAPVLGVVFARRHFARNGDANRWAAFDAGAASMSLALQAGRLGLAAHFMGGFDADRAGEALGAPASDYEPMAAFALGRRGDASSLPEALAERERPSGRKPLAEVAVEGRLTT